MDKRKIIFITGQSESDCEAFVTNECCLQDAIANLYDYHEGGDLTKELFRRIVMQLSEEDTIMLYQEISYREPIREIYRECADCSDMIEKAMRKNNGK